nr:hypothetical protein [Mycobacterium sp. 1245801.1]
MRTFGGRSARCRGRLRPRHLPHLGISARSAAVSAIVVLCALAIAGAGLDAILYRSLLAGVDYATAERVRDITKALQADSFDDLDNALLHTDQRVVATQLIGPDGTVVRRSGSAPKTPLVSPDQFDFNLRRGLPDDAVAGDDMRVSGQKVATRSGVYTVLVGGGSEAVEGTARALAILLACSAPVIVAVVAGATYWLVRRSLQSVDAIRTRVADISTSDLAERAEMPRCGRCRGRSRPRHRADRPPNVRTPLILQGRVLAENTKLSALSAPSQRRRPRLTPSCLVPPALRVVPTG